MSRTNVTIIALLTAAGIISGVIWKNPVNIMLAILGMLALMATVSIKNTGSRVAGTSIFLYTTWIVTRLATYQPIWLTVTVVALSIVGLIVCVPEYVRHRSKQQTSRQQ